MNTAKRSQYALVFLLMCIATSRVFSADIAQFMNLGFSEDGSTFMFGQYGIDEVSSQPYADSFLVDVRANRFVENGVAEFRGSEAVSLGQNGSGALLNLVSEQSERAQSFRIDHLLTGRLMYLRINGNDPDNAIEFRDFNTSRSYNLSLNQSSRQTDDSFEAAFHIRMTIEEPNGSTRQKTIGLPNFFRPDVNRYVIQQMLVSPSEDIAVFVVEKILETDAGRHTRYMVETVSLN